MASNLGFDPSYVSRINSGERVPSNREEYINLICKYIVKTYSSENEINKVSDIIKVDINKLKNSENYYSELKNWFFTNKVNNAEQVNSFLEKLDEFNLSTYIKSINFDKLKVPTVPFQFTGTKNYYGIDEMKNGELDFFKHTVLSKTANTVFMFNDMPMEEKAKDIDFAKKWMFALATSLKKGIHLNVVHNLNRPFDELMLGLQSWIPIYMTGQITPYYFKMPTNSIYNHTLYVSESAALIGEGVQGCEENSKYYLTTKKSELPFYQTMSEDLLKNAHSLMDIYTENDIKKFEKFLKNEQELHALVQNKNLSNTFKNITFKICKGKWVVISKKIEPNIHFVIHHPILRDAIENFIAPIVE